MPLTQKQSVARVLKWERSAAGLVERELRRWGGREGECEVENGNMLLRCYVGAWGVSLGYMPVITIHRGTHNVAH